MPRPHHHGGDLADQTGFGYRREVIIQKWQAVGLLKPSAIKPVITTIEKPLVIKTMERLKANDQKALQKSLKVILG